MTYYVPLNQLRESKGKMFRSVDYTMTYYQGCGTTDTLASGKWACPYCWTKHQHWGSISRYPRLLWEDPQARIPPSIQEATIFMNSAHDSFSPIIPKEWIEDMITFMAHQHPSINFYLQSKWIHRARRHIDTLWEIRDRIILGTTIETNDQDLLDSIGCCAPPVKARAAALKYFKEQGFKTRLSLEPLFDFDVKEMLSLIKDVSPELVEIGLDNYQQKHGLVIPQPSKGKILMLLNGLNGGGIKVFKKGSTNKLLRKAKT